MFCRSSRPVLTAAQNCSKLNKTLFHWEQLLAHRHSITLHVFGREIYLCARCSGIVLGFLGSTTALTPLTPLARYSIPLYIIVLVALLLAIPSIVDWITQTLGFRLSNNGLRLRVGFLEGVGVGVLGLANIPTITKLIILIGFILIVLSIGFFGRRLMQKGFNC